MHWEVLIVPLIALGVWILGTLFKGEEAARTKGGGARRPGSPPGRAPARRPVTDLDRFLEEARRRREAEEKVRVPAAPPLRPTVSRPPLSERPSRPPLSERPSRPRETPPRPAPPVRRVEEVPAAIPVALPAVAEAVLVVPREKTATEAPRSQPSKEAPPVAPVTTRDTRPSPILLQVRALMSKPQTVGAALVLREIFDRPLCLRRR